MKDDEHIKFLKRAVVLAQEGMHQHNGGPFGALVVKDGIVIGEGLNTVTSENDPTAHAEVNAIRKASEKIGSFKLTGCNIYCSTEPCPMCLGAIYWARIDRIFYATSRHEAAAAGFDDGFIYEEFNLEPPERSIKMHQLSEAEGKKVFKLWKAKKNKTLY